jgi:hypothetical protein
VRKDKNAMIRVALHVSTAEVISGKRVQSPLTQDFLLPHWPPLPLPKTKFPLTSLVSEVTVCFLKK